jgi:hypothetical protein
MNPIVDSQKTLQNALEKAESKVSSGAESAGGAGGTPLLSAAVEALRNRLAR